MRPFGLKEMGKRGMALALAAVFLSGFTLCPDPGRREAPRQPTDSSRLLNAAAENKETEDQETQDSDPESFKAEELIREYMQENGITSDQMRVGYYNTATGEEAYVDGDSYQEPASMYKVALCMYWAEKVADGTMTWEDTLMGLTLERLIEETIVYSNNTFAYVLIGSIGSYGEYRRAMFPFYGITTEEEQNAFCRTSAATIRQVLHVLKLLYEEPERYPRVLEYMTESKPTEYFNYLPLPWKVAHKYGYWDQGPIIMNDCGVIYTEDPFLLVVMTRGLPKQQEHLSTICRLLGEYTEGNLPE